MDHAMRRVFGSVWLAFAVRFEKLNGLIGHYGRNHMLVDKLWLASIAAQKDAEIVKPRNDTLQLNTVDQKHGQGRSALADRVQERVLQVLALVCRHVMHPFGSTDAGLAREGQ
jgi:hypothetical protein